MRTKAQIRAQNQRYYAKHKEAENARAATARLRRKHGPDWKKWAAKSLLSDARLRARQRGLEFALSLDDIEMPDTCPVFGLPIRWDTAERTWSSPSLDRIDNRRGYVRGNIWVISWRANSIKGDASPSELRAVARAVDRKKRALRVGASGGSLSLLNTDSP